MCFSQVQRVAFVSSPCLLCLNFIQPPSYYITLHYLTLRYITLHYITVHYLTLHYVALRDMILQDLLTVSSTQLNAWEERFAVKLAFRKLSLLMTSLRCNVWWQHLKANNWLPGNCTVTDLVLYDIDTIWHHACDSEPHHLFCASPLPSVTAFHKQAKRAIGDLIEEQKLHHLWYQYQGVFGRGFGLQTAGILNNSSVSLLRTQGNVKCYTISMLHA